MAELKEAMQRAVEAGSKAGLSYVFTLSEDEYVLASVDERETLHKHAINRAIENGSEVACIRLVPDELFSTTGAAKPYIGWQQRTRIPKPNPYEDVNTAVSAVKTLIQGSRASKTDYVYVPTDLAEALMGFCSDVPGFKR